MSTAPAALITGAARRLGAHMAERLAAAGFRVALHYHASATPAHELAARIRAQGGICEPVAGNLAQPDGVRAVWAAAVERLGPIALLVNNASTFHNDDIATATDAVFDDHLAVNLKAPVALMAAMAAQSALPAGALVVNMLDNKCFAPNPDFFTYTLSKAALLTATRLGAMRLAGRPRVCGIAPSITLISGAQTEANFQKSARINPLGRRVQPDDIADALLLLWRDRELNGEVLVIDGGQMLWQLDRDVAFLVKDGQVDG